jgi:hypothetical protein
MTWQRIHNVSKKEECKICVAYATEIDESRDAKGIAQLDQ